MQRITISIDDDLLEKFDQYTESKGYANRSEGMRDAIRQLLAIERIESNETAPCVGCVVYVYQHRERALSSRLVEAQHDHPEIPTATLHVHLDSANCMEATVLRGTVAEVRHLADHMTSQTGVKHGRLHIIPIDESPHDEPRKETSRRWKPSR